MRIFQRVEAFHQGLDYHLARHNVLVSNLAQAETPGFQPLDLARTGDGNFASVLSTEMAATHPGHLAGTQSGLGSGPPVPGEIVTDRGAAPGLDGNAVSVERETVKIASNQLRYDAIASLTSGALSTLVWAATDGRGG